MDTIQTQTLSENVQSLRDKAREILRMRTINNVMANKYDISKNLKQYEDNLAYTVKKLDITNYKLTKLDEMDPEFDDKKKILDKDAEYFTDEVTRAEKNLEEAKTNNEKALAKCDEDITKWESGEKLVNIEEVNGLVNQMIMKI